MSHSIYRVEYTFHTVGGPTNAHGDTVGSLALARQEALHVQRTYKSVGAHVQRRNPRTTEAWEDMPYTEWNPNRER